MKKFVYLTQVKRDLPEHLEQLESADSDVIFISWKEKSSDPRAIFAPNSTWTFGRNRLYKEVQNTNYEYYIFLDGDVELTHQKVYHGYRSVADANPWRLFEKYLLEFRPAVGVPDYRWHLAGGWKNYGYKDYGQEIQTLRFFDAALTAFHRDAFNVLMPYYDGLEPESECYSQQLLSHLASVLYKGYVLQFNALLSINHCRDRGDAEFYLTIPDNFFLQALKDDDKTHDFFRSSHSTARISHFYERPCVRQPTFGDYKKIPGKIIKSTTLL